MDATLNAMAVQGGFPRGGAQSYYAVSTVNDLKTALGTIASMDGTCFFGVSPALDPTTSPIVGVTADGKPLNPTDFALVGTSGIRLVGQACQDHTSGKLKNIAVQTTCHVV
jgi:hypothetical protein